MHPSMDDPLAFTGIARTRALMGQTDVTRRMLGELEVIGRLTYVPSATIADIHVALGDHEKAIEYLERTVEERAIMAMWLRSDRHWDPLRAHPRFTALLARTGL